MPEPEIRRDLIRCANRAPYSLSADQVSDLLVWWRDIEPARMNQMLALGVPFPDGYVDAYLRETKQGADGAEEEEATE